MPDILTIAFIAAVILIGYAAAAPDDRTLRATRGAAGAVGAGARGAAGHVKAERAKTAPQRAKATADRHKRMSKTLRGRAAVRAEKAAVKVGRGAAVKTGRGLSSAWGAAVAGVKAAPSGYAPAADRAEERKQERYERRGDRMAARKSAKADKAGRPDLTVTTTETPETTSSWWRRKLARLKGRTTDKGHWDYAGCCGCGRPRTDWIAADADGFKEGYCSDCWRAPATDKHLRISPTAKWVTWQQLDDLIAPHRPKPTPSPKEPTVADAPSIPGTELMTIAQQADAVNTAQHRIEDMVEILASLHPWKAGLPEQYASPDIPTTTEIRAAVVVVSELPDLRPIIEQYQTALAGMQRAIGSAQNLGDTMAGFGAKGEAKNFQAA